MKTKILASMLCACLLLFALAGCGLKMPNKTDASPSGEAETSDSGTSGLSTIIGIVSTVSGESITLNLVKTVDTSAGSSASTSALFAAGSSVYAKTGGTVTISVAGTAAVMLENQGYDAGAISDITVGDFLAVALSGNIAVSVVDNGPAKPYTGTPADTTPSDTTPQPSPSDDTATTGVPDSNVSATYSVTQQLNVRTDPDTTGTILGKLTRGTKVTGTVKGGWLEFTYNDQTAYCNAQYLTTEDLPVSSPEPTPTPTGVPDSSKTATYTVTVDDLKARSGPESTAAVLGKLAKGTKVTGTVTDAWLKFTYSGQTAYCSAQYLAAATSSEPSSTPTPTGVPDSNKSATYTVSTDDLNARSSPGTTSTILGKLAKGTKVTGTVLDGWLKFTYNNHTAYCKAQYLTAGG